MVVARAPGAILRGVWQWKWRVLVVAFIVGLTALALWLNISRSQPKSVANPVSGTKSIIAQAGVVPLVQQKVGFKTSGAIRHISVAAGTQVMAGDVLATLEPTSLQLKVEEAEANLAIQTQSIIQTTEVAPADLNAARVALDSSIARQAQVEGGASRTELRAAEEAVASGQAGVASAQAQVARVGAPAAASDVAAAEAAIRAAEAQLASATQKLNDVRARPFPQDEASALLGVDQAKNSLWSQQLSRDSVCGAAGPNSGQCRSADALVAAAETAVKSAQANLDAAKLPATADELAAAAAAVTSASATVTSSREQLAKVKRGATSSDRDAAQAGLDQAKSNLRGAQAKLDQVKVGSTSADREAARSAVEQARANLAKLTSDPTSTTIELSKARIHQAEVALAEAKLALNDASLLAPIGGVVTTIALRDGEIAGAGATVLTIADLTTLRFQTKDLDEISAAKVRVGQNVVVTVPALDKRTFEGTVTDISAEPSISPSGDVNYVARIALNDPPNELRWGQSARIEFK